MNPRFWINPFRWLCELLFLNEKERRLRRRFRLEYVARAPRATRIDMLDPSKSCIREVAKRILEDGKRIPLGTEHGNNYLEGYRQDMIDALKPRIWEARWWRKRRGRRHRFVRPRTGTAA